MISRLTRLAGLGLALVCSPALAHTGSAKDPIVIHMKRGTDKVRLHGMLRRGADCCAYSFAADAGQTMVWKESGAAARVVLQYPDGHIDGPGLPARISLPARGSYLFKVSPDLMADGAFGKFTLSLGITPLGITPGLSEIGRASCR